MPEITKINDRVYLGSFIHCAENTDEFKKLSIDAVINFASELNTKVNPFVQIITLGIDQSFHPTLLDIIDEAEKIIRKYIKQKKTIYLCCSDGNSRAPAVLIYYLIKRKSMTYLDAYELVESKRPEIDIHPNFQTELYEISELNELI